MTTARLVQAPPEGSGLTSGVNRSAYEAVVAGKPTERLVVIAVLEPVGIGQRKTAKGLHQHVVYDWTHLEPLNRERGDNVDMVLHMLDEARGRRHTTQQKLPIDFGERPDNEQRLWLLEQIYAWAEAGELDADDEWRQIHDPQFTPELKKAGAVQLRGFAIEKGIIQADDGPPESEPAGEDPPKKRRARKQGAEPPAAES